MTGREKMKAALAVGGTPEIPAVLPYPNVYFRDRWEEVTSCPWWYKFDPDAAKRAQCVREAVQSTGQDWVRASFIEPRAERENVRLDVREDGVFKIDTRTGEETRIHRPEVAGQDEYAKRIEDEKHLPAADTPEQIDDIVAVPQKHDPMLVRMDGRGDLALTLFNDLRDSHFSYMLVSLPMYHCFRLWGFEQTMLRIATDPGLVAHACQRYMELDIQSIREAAAVGTAGIWLQDLFTDMISADAFRKLNVPVVSQLVDEIHHCGMKAIQYFTGDPTGKLDLILSTGIDALNLEEGKKGFEIDIAEVAERVNGKCTLFGNVDSIAVLEQGTEEELRSEIKRQLAVGRSNGGRFVMSLGSPATPYTPLSRVRLFYELSHELGAS